VRDGVVELWGVITHERARQALIVAAEIPAGLPCLDRYDDRNAIRLSRTRANTKREIVRLNSAINNPGV
jgi:hypothetical protein